MYLSRDANQEHHAHSLSSRHNRKVLSPILKPQEDFFQRFPTFTPEQGKEIKDMIWVISIEAKRLKSSSNLDLNFSTAPIEKLLH